MTYELIVVQSFGPYPVGALVSDPAQIEAILGGEQATRVVRVALAQQPVAKQPPAQQTPAQQIGEGTH